MIDASGLLVSAGSDRHARPSARPGLRAQGDDRKRHAIGRARRLHDDRLHAEHPAVTDTPETVRYILDKAAREGVVGCCRIAAITKDELGRELTDFAALKEAGAIGFTDDGVGVQNAQMMKDAMTLRRVAGPADHRALRGRLARGGRVR